MRGLIYMGATPLLMHIQHQLCYAYAWEFFFLLNSSTSLLNLLMYKSQRGQQRWFRRMQCRNLRDTREEVVDPQRFWYGHHQFWNSISLNSCHCLKTAAVLSIKYNLSRKKLSMPSYIEVWAERSASLTGWGSHDGTMCHNQCQHLPSVFAIFLSYISENPTTKLRNSDCQRVSQGN